MVQFIVLVWCMNCQIDSPSLCRLSSYGTSFFICPAVPTPPQKTDKVGDDTSSGEDNSDDEETAVETSGVSEYQVPTTVC